TYEGGGRYLSTGYVVGRRQAGVCHTRSSRCCGSCPGDRGVKIVDHGRERGAERNSHKATALLAELLVAHRHRDTGTWSKIHCPPLLSGCRRGRQGGECDQ